ncbi:hypothetical protein PG984_012966 [Apiospora sp. TS-2023a]
MRRSKFLGGGATYGNGCGNQSGLEDGAGADYGRRAGGGDGLGLPHGQGHALRRRGVDGGCGARRGRRGLGVGLGATYHTGLRDDGAGRCDRDSSGRLREETRTGAAQLGGPVAQGRGQPVGRAALVLVLPLPEGDGCSESGRFQASHMVSILVVVVVVDSTVAKLVASVVVKVSVLVKETNDVAATTVVGTMMVVYTTEVTVTEAWAVSVAVTGLKRDSSRDCRGTGLDEFAAVETGLGYVRVLVEEVIQRVARALLHLFKYARVQVGK